MGVDACPKCGTACTPGATACKKCGLATERMESFARAQQASIPDALGLAWERVLEQWEQPARHEEVMRLVTQHDAYAWAAAQYRSRAGDPVADKQLERVRKAAEITMLATSARKDDVATRGPYRNTIFLLVAMVVLIVGALLYAWVRSRNAAPEPTTYEEKD